MRDQQMAKKKIRKNVVRANVSHPPGEGKWGPKGPQGSQKEAQREPREAKKEPKRRQNGTRRASETKMEMCKNNHRALQKFTSGGMRIAPEARKREPKRDRDQNKEQRAAKVGPGWRQDAGKSRKRAPQGAPATIRERFLEPSARRGGVGGV